MSMLVALMLSAGLEVTVTGLHSDRGEVRLAVFATSEGWPEGDEKAVRRTAVKIAGGKATVKLDGLSDGRYAAIAFHDEDGDGALKKGAFGLPKEGWGASNDARGTFGPSFDEAAFVVRGGAVISFAVRY